MSESDTVTRTTHQSYGSRIKNSFKGTLGGPILMLVAICLLVWNEGNAIRSVKSLQEGPKNTVSLPSPDKIYPENQARLVHVVGKATADSDSPFLKDPVFGVAPSETALKLKRNVEMYQWLQSTKSSTKKNTGGSATTTTTYSYTKGWKSNVVDSSRFEKHEGHENPSSMPFQSETQTISTIRLGAFTLPNTLVSKMNWFTVYGESTSLGAIEDESLREKVHPIPGGFYLGESPSNPMIGDVRITFQVVNAQTISVIATQLGDTFSPYSTSVGKDIFMIERDAHSASEMYAKAQNAAAIMTWILRVVGIVLNFVGLQAMGKPLSVLADVIPFIGNIVGTATSCVMFPIALGISLLVIAISWLAHRPLFAIPILVTIAGIIYMMGTSNPHKKKTA